MKLLGWMHRKFRQNTGEAPSTDQVVTGPTCNCLCARPSLDGRSTRRRPIPTEELHAGEEVTELFDGFLTIGTLGSMPFQVGDQEEVEETVEEIVEKEAATEADLLAVGAELEKVLAAEAEKERSDMLSSARPSQSVAAGGFPLQEFLFASAVEAGEKADARKERRASLGELFMMAQEEGKEGAAEDARRKVRVHATVKKIMLPRLGSGCGNGHAAETKLDKLLKIFHRKVHPENTDTRKTIKKSCKSKIKDDNKSCNGDNYNNNVEDSYGIIETSKDTRGNEGILINYKSRSLSRSDSNGSREYWIKSDSDYLVLEL